MVDFGVEFGVQESYGPGRVQEAMKSNASLLRHPAPNQFRSLFLPFLFFFNIRTLKVVSQLLGKNPYILQS